MICEYCKKDCTTLGSHLKNSHNITNLKEYYDTFIKRENEGICPICGKETTFRGLTKGYLTYCSSKCSNAAKEVVAKKKQTTKEHFGDENYRNIEQSRATRLSLYGQFNSKECIRKISATKQSKTVEEIAEATEKSRQTRDSKWCQWRAPDTTAKIANTKLQNHGSATYNNRMQAIDTCLAKYGVSHPSKIFLAKFIKNNNTAELIEDSGETVTIKCKHCNSVREISRCNIISREHDTLCDVCNPYLEKANGKSIEEQQLVEFIREIYNDTIIENDRTVLNGRELDIYLPERKLAFEFDGLYWHSDEFKDAKYHLAKTEKCLEKDIQLIHIFEDEWHYKQEIVKSRIRNLIGLSTKIFARKCTVKTVDSTTAMKFLNDNHIQGYCSSTYKYGLFCEDELVSLMTFGKSRFKDSEFELLRFCNKLNFTVIGGASKLFKHFLADHKEITTIVSYADRRWSTGKLYESLRFVKEKTTPPNYFYVKQFERENRLKYQKHILVATGADQTKTEQEIMCEKGYRRIYDCGTLKYKYNKYATI